MRMREITETRVRYGYRRVYVLLRREGWRINHKKVYRIYSEQGFGLRNKRPRRRVSAAHRQRGEGPTTIDQVWSMDFVSDSLFNGRRIRALTVVDTYSRECLAIHVDTSITSSDVVTVLDSVTERRGTPRSIRTDNGSEFVSVNVDKWAYGNGVAMDYSRPGKPTDNAIIEAFHRSFRDECLSIHWFLSLEDARIKIADWRRDYNEFRPHSALDEQTPREFANHVRAEKTPHLAGTVLG